MLHEFLSGIAAAFHTVVILLFPLSGKSRLRDFPERISPQPVMIKQRLSPDLRLFSGRTAEARYSSFAVKILLVAEGEDPLRLEADKDRHDPAIENSLREEHQREKGKITVIEHLPGIARGQEQEEHCQ
jgi:hypothetical protein